MTEAILLFGDSRNPTLSWRTGFIAPDPVVYIEVDGKGTLLVSAMELGRARKEASAGAIRSYDEFSFSARYREGGERHAYAGMVLALLAEAGVDRVRVQPDFPVALARAIEAGDVVVDADQPLFESERRRKRPDELDAIQASQAAAQAGLTVARELLRDAEVREGKLYHGGEPLTSAAVKSVIEVELLRLGCDTPEGTIVAGGPDAADPHVDDSGHLNAGEAVIVDIFPQGKKSRYFGDITRTFVPGEPREDWLRMYDAVHAARAAALEQLRAGVSGREAHLAVCRTLYEAGFSTLVEGFQREGVPTMIHGTGHGVGLEIHEAPRVSDVDIELQEGDVVTIEPGLYSPEIGGVRLEDIVVVTKDDYRSLTDYPLDWKP
ncbi:MAG TPA: Xaa-Pro peptidase family protein [Candidatus Dormibacteraeota bacterium]|nr:Xaa-Pro peptidase family protein [Candidatus Dormibacteraeota bacterium]